MTEHPKKHHYVPQFYIRRFALPDDTNKVMVLERHGDIVVSGPKSIANIGYEDGLHDYEAVTEGASRSIEGDLNRNIETPFSKGPTWLKISEGRCASLDAADLAPLYGFAKHLQSRNVETLRFIESQHRRYLAGELENELTPDEREMHKWIAANKGASHELFRAGAMDTLLPSDASAINMIVCKASDRFRSSTNPAIRLTFPGNESVFGEMFKSLRTWWLTLDHYWGVLITAGGPSGFSTWPVPKEFVRVINQRFLCQLTMGDARYMLADDDHITDDLTWAGFGLTNLTSRGMRFAKTFQSS
jgi:hypothetical protein